MGSAVECNEDDGKERVVGVEDNGVETDSCAGGEDERLYK